MVHVGDSEAQEVFPPPCPGIVVKLQWSKLGSVAVVSCRQFLMRVNGDYLALAGGGAVMVVLHPLGELQVVQRARLDQLVHLDVLWAARRIVR